MMLDRDKEDTHFVRRVLAIYKLTGEDSDRTAYYLRHEQEYNGEIHRVIDHHT